MLDLGIVKPGSTIYVPFQTFDSNDPSASVTITGLAVTDIEIYKDGGITQRASDAGYTLLDTDGIDFDAITGIHGVSINLSDNTTAGFYSSGSQYMVVIASITVDAATINFIPVIFQIGYPDAILNTTIATLASQTSFTLTSGPAEDNALNNCVVCIHDVASAVQLGFAVISAYTGATKTITLSAGVTFTAAATDNIAIYPPTNINWVGATLQTAGDIIGDTNNIQTRLPTSLVDGRMDSDIGAKTGNVALSTQEKLDVNAEVDTALVDVNLDHLVGTATAIPAITAGTYIDQMMDDGTAVFDRTTDSLQAIRDRGDSAWTTGAGESDRLLMVDTTIATLASQTSFTLTAGSADDNAYNNCTIVVEDVSTSTQKAVGVVIAYTGATRTVTLKEALVFTIATTDKVYILGENSLKSTVSNRQLDVTSTGAAGIDWGNVENKTTANDLSATDIQLCDTTTTLTNLPTIPSNWITAAGINAGALNGKGDWNVGKTGYALSSAGTLAIWHEALANIVTASTIGKLLKDEITAARMATLTDWIDGGRLDLLLDAIKAVTDLLPNAGALTSLAQAAVCTEARLSELDAATVGKMANQADEIRTDTEDIQTQIGTAGVGLTNLGGMSTAMKASVVTEVINALDDAGIVMVRTTIATLASQTSFTLTAGSADDNAYNGCIAVIEDSSTVTQKAYGDVLDYTGSTKTITLRNDPAIFTIATTDKITILPLTTTNIMGSRVPSPQTGAPTTYDGLQYLTREWVKNKLQYTKATDVMRLFEDNGSTVKLTFTMTDDATEATRGAGT